MKSETILSGPGGNGKTFLSSVICQMFDDERVFRTTASELLKIMTRVPLLIGHSIRLIVIEECSLAEIINFAVNVKTDASVLYLTTDSVDQLPEGHFNVIRCTHNLYK